MVKTIQVSDETYSLLVIAKRATELKYDSLVRFSLRSLFQAFDMMEPTATDEQTDAAVRDNLAEFLSEKMEDRDEYHGARKVKR